MHDLEKIPLWKPSKKYIKKTQISAFIESVNKRFNLALKNYGQLYNWSVKCIPDFWSALWEFGPIMHSRPPTEVVEDITKMPGSNWFSGALLNFSENLLHFRDHGTAIIFKGEGQNIKQLTYAELFSEVEKMAHALKSSGLKAGDRVAGFMPNLPETIIAMLASTALGAIWSSCSPDFGIRGVLDRFRQIKPKIIFSADGYFYNGKKFDSLKKLKIILADLPTVEKVIIVPYTQEKPDISTITASFLYKDFLSDSQPEPIIFEQLPFDHPLYIMYSSGTTGLPKSIVHSAGGTLIQHLKELRLHTDLTREDTIFYFTTCGWMMWNWLITSLAVGARLVLYDGSPFYPDSGAMWKLADSLKITVFGTSAKFIGASEAAGEIPKNNVNLSSLRVILSTGSPLMQENFYYIYNKVKKNLQLSSISGGTDIISCFALGNPILPVYSGKLQCRGLGMAVEAFDMDGKKVYNKKGELVCTKAFPSMPIYFWNDKNGKKYRQAYFDKYPGIWHHGDFISIDKQGGVEIFGRSDATLNPGGVRIGTAEIYGVLEKFSEVLDCLVVGQKWQEDERIVLFLKLADGSNLDDYLIQSIRNKIRNDCSPRHIPAKILAILDIPYTISGKKVEIAVKKIIHGETVSNRDALANPESLKYYEDLPALKS
ncbi:MAG: acetoacetate--CoA ligase [Candidatus Neomarinimicrobiota bacterium]